jgi:hypothetical protein
VPAEGQPPTAWERWIEVGFELFAALAWLGSSAHRRPPPTRARSTAGPRRLAETYPDAIFCTLLGHRPSPKRTPWGLRQRIEALQRKGIVDEDGGSGTARSTSSTRARPPIAAYGLAAGLGTWVGDPDEGVIVLPTAELLDRYEKLPPPARAQLPISVSPGAAYTGTAMERSRNGRVTDRATPPPNPAGAPGSARSASARCRRATISQSSRSSCAPRASRRWASSSSTARSRHPEPLPGAGQGRGAQAAAEGC